MTTELGAWVDIRDADRRQYENVTFAAAALKRMGYRPGAQQ
jgi:hypothetical protein